MGWGGCTSFCGDFLPLILSVGKGGRGISSTSLSGEGKGSSLWGGMGVGGCEGGRAFYFCLWDLVKGARQWLSGGSVDCVLNLLRCICDFVFELYSL